MEDYLDKFYTLISEVYYTNLYTIVVKFHCGLQISIQNQITTLLMDRSEDIDTNTWYNAACRIDQARQANKAFQLTQ